MFELYFCYFSLKSQQLELDCHVTFTHASHRRNLNVFDDAVTCHASTTNMSVNLKQIKELSSV